MTSFERAQHADWLLSEGRHAEAWIELEKIPLEDSEIIEVLRVRVQTLFALRRFERGVEMARRLVDLCPDETIHWTWLAMASRKVFGIGAATQIYEEAVARYPATGIFRYSLASRYCSLGRFEEAWEHMALALVLDPSWREVALDDPALGEIWDVVV